MGEIRVWKKLLVFMLCFASAMATSNAQPVITVNHHTIPENPGTGYFIISIDISNSGSDAKNLRLSLFENENYLALIDSGEKVSSLYVQLGDLSAGSTSVQIKAYAERPGIYQLELRLRYVNATGGESGSIDRLMAIVVTEKPVLAISDTLAIKPGEVEEFSLRVKNFGGEMRDVSIKFETPQGIISDSSLAFDVWHPDEEKMLNFRLIADEEAVTGAYEMGLVIEYTDTFGVRNVERISVALNVVGKPVLILANQTLIPEKIYPDSDFTLKIDVQNIGSDEAKNVKAVLTYPDGFSGESEKFLGSIAKDELRSMSFTLKVGSDIVSGSYAFGLTLYSGGERYDFSFEVFVSDPGVISLDVAGVYTSPQKLGEGEDFKLSLQIENSGKQDAKAVSIKLLLPEGFEGKSNYFIGTLESGDSATATFELKAGSSGNHVIKAEISYMDSAFKKHEVTKEFTLYVFPKDYTAILAALGAAVAIAAVWFFKWRKK